MFSFVKNALFGASSKQEIEELRRENNEIKRDNEEIKGLLRELLTNKRKRDDDEERVEDGEQERNKRVHVETPPVSTIPTNNNTPLPLSSLSIPSSTSAPSTSLAMPPLASSSTSLPPSSSTTIPPPPPPAMSVPPAGSFVVSAGGSVDLNNNNNNPTQSHNPTTESHNPTTTESHNPTTTSDSNNSTASNNTTITTNNNAPPAKKDVMISFNCRTMTKFAEQLMEALEKTNKFDVFCCTKTLKFGEVYRVQISSATQKANIFICLLNAGWANSSETLSEYLVMEKKVNNGKGGAVFPIVFESDDDKWMEKPAVDWILSKYQGYFIKKEDASNSDTWQGHIDKCVGQLCQENF